MEKIYGGDRMICNLDCFSCPYPDCINDNPEPINTDEYILTVKQLEKRRKARERMRRIRKENPNYNKEYYWANREKELKRNSEAKKAKREHYNAYKRKRYAENREEMCRKRREYRARKKAEAVS